MKLAIGLCKGGMWHSVCDCVRVLGQLQAGILVCCKSTWVTAGSSTVQLSTGLAPMLEAVV
jgi:hypothetical protein